MKALWSACRQPNSSAEATLSKLAKGKAKAESYGWGAPQEAQFSGNFDAITASELINDIEALFE